MEMHLGKQALVMQYTNELMVAVEMITYNHEKYIAQAIESVLMQKTDFNYKLIICEDSSTDNTAKICLEYKNKYPDKIDLYLNEKNIGVQLNAKKLHSLSFSSHAKYIAMLDGDDYWTDENKLQKQVDFLESHPDFAICFHKLRIEYSENVPQNFPLINENTPEITSIRDLAQRNYIHTATTVFRNVLKELPIWFNDLPFADWPLFLVIATFGKIKFFDKEMAVYRVHYGGIHSTKTYQAEKMLSLFYPLGHDSVFDKFPDVKKHFVKVYNYHYVCVYCLEMYGKKDKARIEKSRILWKYGSWKMKPFFWLPLIFGSSSNKVMDIIRQAVPLSKLKQELFRNFFAKKSHT